MPAKWSFGPVSEADCVIDVPTLGPANEPLCLAHQTTAYKVLAGVYLRDDGYVLRQRFGTETYALAPTQIATMQAAGQLPDPLPALHISASRCRWVPAVAGDSGVSRGVGGAQCLAAISGDFHRAAA